MEQGSQELEETGENGNLVIQYNGRIEGDPVKEVQVVIEHLEI